MSMKTDGATEQHGTKRGTIGARTRAARQEQGVSLRAL